MNGTSLCYAGKAHVVVPQVWEYSMALPCIAIHFHMFPLTVSKALPVVEQKALTTVPIVCLDVSYSQYSLTQR